MKKFITLLIVLSFVIGTVGCLPIPLKIVSDISNNPSDYYGDNDRSNKKANKNETHSLNSDGVVDILINGEIGDISISRSESLDVIVDTKSEARASTLERANEILSNMKYKVEASGSSINIDTSVMSNYINKKSHENITIDLLIKIPDNINNIVISSNIGEVEINDITAAFDIKTNIGGIDLKKCNLLGNSNFEINIGDISVVAESIDNSNSIDASSNIGDIDISVPNNSNYTANFKTSLNNNTTKSGDGKTNIKLDSNVGSVTLR